MEIEPGIHQIVLDQPHYPGALPVNIFLVTGEKAAAFIDTGWGKDGQPEALLQYVRSHDIPRVEHIVLSHRHVDHASGASALQKALGSEVITHPVEKQYVEEGSKSGLKVERVVRDGEKQDLGGLTLEFVHTPGHTLGSLSVFIPEQQALFAGDNILSVGTPVISHGQGDMAKYLESIQKMAGYNPKNIYPGHGHVIRRALGKLQYVLKHRLQKEAQILGLLNNGGRTPEQLLSVIYRRLPERLHRSAIGQIQSHLLKLEREGRVLATPDGVYRLR